MSTFVVHVDLHKPSIILPLSVFYMGLLTGVNLMTVLGHIPKRLATPHCPVR